MELENQAHERCYALVKSYLAQAFGEMAEANPDHPSFTVSSGWHVFVAVGDTGEDSAAVDIYTWVGKGIELTPPVMRFLLEKNADLRFAHCGVDTEGDIIVQTGLIDSMVSKEALKTLVNAIAAAGLEFDDELSMRFR